MSGRTERRDAAREIQAERAPHDGAEVQLEVEVEQVDRAQLVAAEALGDERPRGQPEDIETQRLQVHVAAQGLRGLTVDQEPSAVSRTQSRTAAGRLSKIVMSSTARMECIDGLASTTLNPET